MDELATRGPTTCAHATPWHRRSVTSVGAAVLGSCASRTNRQSLHHACTTCAFLFDATTCTSDVCRQRGAALRGRSSHSD